MWAYSSLGFSDVSSMAAGRSCALPVLADERPARRSGTAPCFLRRASLFSFAHAFLYLSITALYARARML